MNESSCIFHMARRHLTLPIHVGQRKTQVFLGDVHPKTNMDTQNGALEKVTPF